MYRQLIQPNYNIPYTGGLCEKFIENTVGRTGIFSSATAAWNANIGNHAELPPKGLRVPVFFKLGSTPYGHVALMLEDGRVASSTLEGNHKTAYIHPNLQDLINVYSRNNKGCTYLGWSEYIGKLKVVGDDMTIQSNESTFLVWERAMKVARGQSLSRDDFNREFVGKSEWEMLQAVVFGRESDVQYDYAQWGKMAKDDGWDKQIKNLTEDNQKKDETIGELRKELANKPGKLDKKSVVDYIETNLK